MLVLPPVDWSPYFTFPVACSIRTVDQSAPSSSATIIASAVRVPCPRSERGTVTVTSPSLPIFKYTLGETELVSTGVLVGCTSVGLGVEVATGFWVGWLVGAL